MVQATKRSEEELVREALENYVELKTWQYAKTKKFGRNKKREGQAY